MSFDAINLPPMVDWEAHVAQKKQLPPEFRLAMPDDSLSSTPKGTVLFFKTDIPARPGWGVLFEDREGYRYVRRYVEVRGGHWRAEATAPGFHTFDSVEDGLTVLAVMTDKLVDGSV